MYDIPKFIKMLRDLFPLTEFKYVFDKKENLHQILHNNKNLEENEQKIADLLYEYYYKNNNFNVMISYNFWDEIDQNSRVDNIQISISFRSKTKVGKYNSNYKYEDTDFNTELKGKYANFNSEQSFYNIGKAS